MADPQDVHARRRGDVLEIGQPFFAFDLADDGGVLVGVGGELDRLGGHVVRLRIVHHHAALAERRVFDGIDDGLGLLAVLHVRNHDAERAGVHGAGDEVVLDLGDAHERSDVGGLEPGEEIGQIGGRVGRVLGVDDDEVEASVGGDLCDAARAELHDHVADGHFAGRQFLFETIRFHCVVALSCSACAQRSRRDACLRWKSGLSATSGFTVCLGMRPWNTSRMLRRAWIVLSR